jgi:hypothetical protein
LVHSFIIVDVDREGNLVDDFEGVFQGGFEGRDDYNGVDISL